MARLKSGTPDTSVAVAVAAVSDIHSHPMRTESAVAAVEPVAGWVAAYRAHSAVDLVVRPVHLELRVELEAVGPVIATTMVEVVVAEFRLQE